MEDGNALRFSEEILLLLLRDGDGRFARVRDRGVDYALAGGVLLDLAFENRIDTDLSTLVVLDSTPTGDALLDPLLAEMAAGPPLDATGWLRRAAAGADDLRDKVFDRLLAGHVLERYRTRVLGILPSRRLRVVSDGPGAAVKPRARAVLFDTGVPGPRDAAIVALAEACGILPHMLTPAELERVAPRVKALRGMELIGRAVTRAAWNVDLDAAVAGRR